MYCYWLCWPDVKYIYMYIDQGFWLKLLEYGVDGNFFSVVFNMYKDIKSCVFSNNAYSDFFVSLNGVRQAENLSPLLFAVYVK